MTIFATLGIILLLTFAALAFGLLIVLVVLIQEIGPLLDWLGKLRRREKPRTTPSTLLHSCSSTGRPDKSLSHLEMNRIGTRSNGNTPPASTPVLQSNTSCQSDR